MRILILKISSLGDIIHALPAVRDAKNQYPTAEIDWVIEESFQAIAQLSNAVNRVFPISFRRWGKQWYNLKMFREIVAQIKAIRQERYDYIIDPQGLLKTTLLGFFCRGPRFGYSFTSARDPFSSLWYRKRSVVSKKLHAITRIRQLVASILNYPVPQTEPDYGIDPLALVPFKAQKPYYVLLHGTTWETKHWPEVYWVDLAKRLMSTETDTLVLFGNPAEAERAKRIAAAATNVKILPKLSLKEVAGVLKTALGVVTVDTGLGHLAAALRAPTLGLYGPTDPMLCRNYGINQRHLKVEFECAPCAKRRCKFTKQDEHFPPCFKTIPPNKVFDALQHFKTPGV